MTSLPADPSLAAAVLDALPVATIVVDAGFRILHANAAARGALRVVAGVDLGEALGCVEASGGTCGSRERCAGCAFRGAVARALEGEKVRARGFLLRSDAKGEPEDLHLLAAATPLDRGGAREVVLVLEDADRLLLDPAVVRICAGCGRVEDEEGGWLPLHRYVEDRLGLPLEEICAECAHAGGAR